jgi:CheY-like chemotaxis protein
VKVLLIDDERDIRRIASLCLSRVGGFTVLEAGGSAEGLALAESERPDVILLDVMMPGTDGPSTLLELRQRPATAAIPVIFLTAKALQSEIDRLKALGARGVITKPFDPMSLAPLVKSILGETG